MVTERALARRGAAAAPAPAPAAAAVLWHEEAAALERAILVAAPDAIVLVDGRGRIVLANPAVQALTGHAPEALLGQPLDVLLPPEVRARHGGMVQRFFHAPQPRPMGRVPHLRLWHRDGHEVPVDIALGTFESPTLGPCAVAFLRDVSELRQMAEALRHQATHDALTGLYNRAQFLELLRLTTAQTQRAGRACAVLLLDLDDFKGINDTLGHAAGDRVLVEVARRLRAVLRGGDVVARLGGDEFTVLLPDLPDADAVATVAGKIQQALQAPLGVEGVTVTFGASIGIALCPDDATDADALLRCADLAMYAAKAGGRHGWQRYTPGLGEAMDERMRLGERLRHALMTGGLALHYQPQWDLRAGRVSAVEALLRWNDPLLGVVAPARFIPVAESTGLILALDDWVLEQACRQARVWHDAGWVVRVAVNLSAHQFHQRELVPQVCAHLARHQLPGSALELEITETHAMADPQLARSVCAALAAHGVRWALDDFGTGHSSLAQLKRLPVHRLKIAREFIVQLPHDAADRALVRGVGGLARRLGLETVAEGVETPAQWACLQRSRIDAIQGWVLARAEPAAAVARWFGPMLPPVFSDETPGPVLREHG